MLERKKMMSINANKVKYIFSVLAFLFFVFYGYGAVENNTEISVEVLLRRMEKAIDPTGTLTDSYTRITRGVMCMPLQKFKANVIIKYKNPDKLLIKTTLEDGKYIVQAYNGKTGWKSSSGKKPVKMEGKELDSFRLGTALEGSQSRWYSLFRKMEIKKTDEKIGIYDCYKLTCYPKKEYNTSIPVVFYVDNKEYLIRKMELSVFSAVGIIAETIFVYKYKNFDNVLIPVETRTNVLKADVLYKISQCIFNENISDSEFNFP